MKELKSQPDLNSRGLISRRDILRVADFALGAGLGANVMHGYVNFKTDQKGENEKISLEIFKEKTQSLLEGEDCDRVALLSAIKSLKISGTTRVDLELKSGSVLRVIFLKDGSGFVMEMYKKEIQPADVPARKAVI